MTTTERRHRYHQRPTREIEWALDSPLRQRILATLAGVDRADFAFVRDAVEVSGSVLSRQVAMLSRVGLVTTSRGTIARRRGVWLALTSKGSRALQDHLAATRGSPAPESEVPSGVGC
jgi:DNA-binding MarR family transcriptional regulator